MGSFFDWKKRRAILPEGKFNNIVLRIDVSKQVTSHLARCCNAVAAEQAKNLASWRK